MWIRASSIKRLVDRIKRKKELLRVPSFYFIVFLGITLKYVVINDLIEGIS